MTTVDAQAARPAGQSPPHAARAARALARSAAVGPAPHITPPGVHPAGEEVGHVAVRGATPLRPSVMCDLDNTLWSLIAGIEHALDDHTIAARVDTWESLADILGGHDATWRAFDGAFRPEVMLAVGPLPGAVAAMSDLRARGVGVVVITSRPASGIETVRAALDAWGCPWDEIVCGLSDKLPLCRERGGNILVDDHPDTLVRAQRAGMHALSLTWSYNRHLGAEGVTLAEHWDALHADILRCMRPPPHPGPVSARRA